ncbi:MAG TPA: rhomboid family intramembrane serine protease [Dehalococcoidia bacterium]|nr:rhomboid family intramembrane serine protease [Dehalococcoidia bacterium]
MNQQADLIYNCVMRTYRNVNLNVLWFLIALNVVLFIIELVIGGYPITANNEIVHFLGLTPSLLAQQPWTIISSMFIHGGFTHIIFNMIALYFLGSFLIRAAGERGFLSVFFLGGIAGNVLYFLLGPPSIPGVGASGGIFALAGVLAIIVPRVPVIMFPIPVPMPLWIAVIILLVLSFLFAGIAWQAHLGGLLLGLIAGLIYRRRRRISYF